MSNKIMVTGGTGYIGSWVVKGLLENGHHVNLTLRNKDNKEKYEHLLQIANTTDGNLEIFEADLLKFGSYDKSLEGCDTVIHMASPFKLNVKDPIANLIKPALEGTENVLSSVNKFPHVKKVILTSSVVSIYGDAKDMKDQGLEYFTEDQWNTTSSKNHQPYPYSKTLAEKKAWELHDNQERWSLCVINPSFVMGPSLTKSSDSESLKFMKDLLYGKMQFGAPDLMFGVVDVRDVAEAHINAVEIDNTEGRHILSNESMTVLEMANTIRKSFPGKFKLPKSTSPKWLLKILGPFVGISSKFVENNVGYPLRFNNTKSKKTLNIDYLSLEKTLQDMIEEMDK
ncbi:SDR family oxidoreductase [Marinigracilibium pacificum]|uniref:Aldehyde reductase n=1 Tax=Marinigracilibium pacificum TaxID=2729599 RepID=A0A848J0N2_9BACT|nr:aldehyde reductase [Marinigracilibium pacificum]NMM49221.1 aldehyde reductase [Marinigracilibium pacificum]